MSNSLKGCVSFYFLAEKWGGRSSRDKDLESVSMDQQSLKGMWHIFKYILNKNHEVFNDLKTCFKFEATLFVTL